MFDLSLCVVLWCALGHAHDTTGTRPPISIVLGTELIDPNEIADHGMVIEHYRAFGGLVGTTGRLTPVIGHLPLRVRLWIVSADGGGSWAARPVPIRGTQWNWTARLRVRVHAHVAAEWWHFSNSGSGRPNPSIDLWGVGVHW